MLMNIFVGKTFFAQPVVLLNDRTTFIDTTARKITMCQAWCEIFWIVERNHAQHAVIFAENGGTTVWRFQRLSHNSSVNIFKPSPFVHTSTHYPTSSDGSYSYNSKDNTDSDWYYTTTSTPWRQSTTTRRTTTTTTTTTTPRTTTHLHTWAQPPAAPKTAYFDNPFHNRFQKGGGAYDPSTTRTTSSYNIWSTRTTTRNPYEWGQYYSTSPKSIAPSVDESYDTVAPLYSVTPSTERTTRTPYGNIRPSTYNSVFDVYFNQIKAYKLKNNLQLRCLAGKINPSENEQYYICYTVGCDPWKRI